MLRFIFSGDSSTFFTILILSFIDGLLNGYLHNSGFRRDIVSYDNDRQARSSVVAERRIATIDLLFAIWMDTHLCRELAR